MSLLRCSLRVVGPTRDAGRIASQGLLRRSLSPRLSGAGLRGFISSSRSGSDSADSQSAHAPLHRSSFSANRIEDAAASKASLLSSLSTNNASVQPDSSARKPASDHDPTSSSSSSSSSSPPVSIPSPSIQTELPHRRRKRLKDEAAAGDAEAEHVIPPDASAQLSAISSALPTTSPRRKMAAFLALCKPRLSILVVLTTTTAYGMYPISTLLALDPSMTPLPTLSTSTLTFLYLTVGTFLSSCCANTINMYLEPKYDALMSRTRNRPLVRGLVSRRGAVLFALATAVSGLGLLYFGTNPTVTALSAGNIILYGFIYTPLKRIHVINTWVGAIVGGIPPLMGWVAAAGQTATTGHDTWRDMLFSEDSIGGWLLGGILFAWQFPHFNALSHTIREEYKRAGYKMLCWKNPAMNARVALRYSVLMFPISIGLWWVGVVGHGFLVSSSLANAWLVKEAYRFWKFQGGQGSARGLFWASIWQLPVLLVGGLVTKKGLWDGVWRQAFGQPEDPEDDEADYMYLDEEEEAAASAAAAAAARP
ncbi:protoheme IX farnesyltransferase [Aspergillus saccharolyticus JOP 1030-1]|uniref:Protoheme IX farnesyltransferase, mitochondrial n=1 Tax=Aspergillus saccharolyticus JOP 1030-1 TaxID=1450539 RepID=A0A319A5L7_9EURO|nr:mitochondria protoheme IX farnesyltransferase [Aspergillus saccharolyticus JOP 1030-1]PYH47358.1 mitochondria protoheme IX farnesyltransferase [Aspergillus saccharolyticus JOP 1030-1]